jgi:hypothetical protein
MNAVKIPDRNFFRDLAWIRPIATLPKNVIEMDVAMAQRPAARARGNQSSMIQR